MHLDDLHARLEAWADQHGFARVSYDKKGASFWRSLAWRCIERRLTVDDTMQALDGWRWHMVCLSEEEDWTVDQCQRRARAIIGEWAKRKYPAPAVREQWERTAIVKLCDARRRGDKIPFVPEGKCWDYMVEHYGHNYWIG